MSWQASPQRVPNLGVVYVVLGILGVQAPAAELASLRASATHARLVRVEIAYQGFSFGCVCGVFGYIPFTLSAFSVDHRSQMFHSEGHVPVKRASFMQAVLQAEVFTSASLMRTSVLSISIGGVATLSFHKECISLQWVRRRII
jgi:hypothetical protein